MTEVLPDRESSPIKLAVVGFGWFAELLVDRIFTGLSTIALSGVVDPDVSRRARANELRLPAAATLEELMTITPIDAVAVLTPHDTHREVVTDAARRSVHVFCEKAFAVTADDCIAMIDACREAGVTLMVGHMQKLFPAHARGVDLARSGVYGRVRAAHINGYHWCPVLPGWWRSKRRCGGLLYWTGIHDMDTLRSLVGSEVEAVYATASTWDDYTDYEDAVSATLRFTDGTMVSLNVAEQYPLDDFEHSFEIDVLMESGGIRVVPGRATVEHGRANDHAKQPLTVEQFGTFAEMEEVAYRQEFTAFAGAIRAGTVIDVTVVDGLRCVETLEAIYRSIECGLPVAVERAVVPVSSG